MKLLAVLSTVVFLCATQSVLAQNDPKAKAVLDAVSKKVSSLKTMKADFTLQLTGGKGSNITDTRKGSVALKGQKYHVVLGPQEMFCDSKTMWTYNSEVKEVQVANYNASEQTMSPAKLFTPSFFEKEYSFSYKGVRNEHGKKCDVIELTPHDKSKQLSKVELLVDKASSMIVGGNYWEKSGNKYNVTISNLKQNVDIPDTRFAWNTKANPDVEVVDLR